MILKIFTKRTKGGDLVSSELEWKEWLIEADEIYKKPIEESSTHYLRTQEKFPERGLISGMFIEEYTALQGYLENSDIPYLGSLKGDALKDINNNISKFEDNWICWLNNSPWSYTDYHCYKTVFSKLFSMENTPSSLVGFEFLCKKGDFSQRITVFTKFQGYEILNDKGVVIEKYVTAIN